jgi:hypothetical protein
VLLLAIAALGCSHSVLAGASDIVEYHGWKIDISRVSEPRNTAVAALTHQLDLVENVAMAQDIRTFMRSVPIAAMPSRKDGEVAHYDRAQGIDVRPQDLDPKQPIILRELMHAYYDAHIGGNNADVVRYFKQAQSSGKWPADADIVRDIGEFFSSTATVYVFGAMNRPPFTQGQLQASQPEYWVWLGTVFDGFHGCE